MSIFNTTTSGNGKAKWTKEQDAALIALANQGKSRKDIAAAVKHPENSITYRIRFLKAIEEKFTAAQAEKPEDERETIESVDQLLGLVKY